MHANSTTIPEAPLPLGNVTELTLDSFAGNALTVYVIYLLYGRLKPADNRYLRYRNNVIYGDKIATTCNETCLSGSLAEQYERSG